MAMPSEQIKWVCALLIMHASSAAPHTRKRQGADAFNTAPATYGDYVAGQRSKTDALAANGTVAPQWQWASRESIAAIAEHVKAHVSLKNKFALCHGGRRAQRAGGGLVSPAAAGRTGLGH